jgi:hypothetical protein
VKNENKNGMFHNNIAILFLNCKISKEKIVAFGLCITNLPCPCIYAFTTL